MAFKPRFIASINTGRAKFANADGVALKTLFTAGVSDSRVESISITSTDIAAKVVGLYLSDGTADHLIASVSVPPGTGSNGTLPAIELLTSAVAPWVDADGAINIKAGFTLKLGVATAVSAGNSIDAVAFGGDF